MIVQLLIDAGADANAEGSDGVSTSSVEDEIKCLGREKCCEPVNADRRGVEDGELEFLEKATEHPRILAFEFVTYVAQKAKLFDELGDTNRELGALRQTCEYIVLKWLSTYVEMGGLT